MPDYCSCPCHGDTMSMICGTCCTDEEPEEECQAPEEET